MTKAESSTGALAKLAGRLWFWWSLFVAAMLLLVIGPPVITAALVARRPYWVYPFALFGARNWLRLSGVRVRVRGLENLDPRRSYVFIANHRSFLDTAMLFYHLRRRIGILAKNRTNRESALRTTKAATDRLRAGVSFGVFAEGTRARPGELLPFKKGGFYMAVEAGVPVVPVAFKHTDELMGKGTGVARAGTAEMVVLPPIETAGLDGVGVKRLTERTRAAIAEELARE